MTIDSPTPPPLSLLLFPEPTVVLTVVPGPIVVLTVVPGPTVVLLLLLIQKHCSALNVWIL